MTRNLAVPLAALLLAGALAGCVGNDDAEIQIAFTYRLTDLITDKDPRRLADWIEDQTGKTAAIYNVGDSTAALEALRFGQADIAFLDAGAAWMGWTQLGLQAIAADQKADGRTFYTASAWAHNESDIQSAADLKGVTSCHTGRLKSAGMFLPMSYLIREGHIDPTQYGDDITEVVAMAEDFFDQPVIGGAYGGYAGSLKCLSEGKGDVAFVRDTTPMDYCGDKPRDWCLPLEDYRLVVEFGPVPSHPVMVSPHTSAATRTAILDALLALNDDPTGQSILNEVLETPGITATDAETHLGGYADLISVLPGIEEHIRK